MLIPIPITSTYTRAMIIVHHLGHVQAVLRIAQRCGIKAITLHSPKAAAAYGGAEYFKEILREASKECPDIHIAFILDCGSFPGFVFGALRAGFKQIRFTGHSSLLPPLIALVQQYKAEILHEPLTPPYLDLCEVSSAERAIELYMQTTA